MYIKNFHPDTTNAELITEFSRFGEATSANVVRHPDGTSRGYGFVNFSTLEHATRAVAGMDRTKWRGHVLHVALAPPKNSIGGVSRAAPTDWLLYPTTAVLGSELTSWRAR